MSASALSFKKIFLGICIALSFLCALGILYPLDASAADALPQGPLPNGATLDTLSDTEEVVPKTCLSFSLRTGLHANWADCVARVANGVMSVAAMFLWGAGWFMDQSIQATINSKAFFDKIPVVTIGWKIFRDIANIGFIFALLWTAISTIIGTLHGDVKRTLVKLVVFALLVNFSLFIARAVYDASNIITIHFYDLMTLDGPEGTRSSISAVFMDGLKIQTLYDIDSIGKINPSDPAFKNMPPEARAAFEQKGGATVNEWNILLIGIGGTVIILVAAFVFFATSMMFLSRAVGIMFLMMLSPLAFVGAILPGFSEKTGQWWSKLISWSFFAPVFMVLAYIVAQTITQMQSSGFITNQSFASAFTSGNGFVIAINYVLIIFLLTGSLALATSIGGPQITGFGVSLAKTMRGYVGKGAAYQSRAFIRHGALAPLRQTSTVLGTVSQGVGWVGEKVGLKNNSFTRAGDKMKGFGQKEGFTSIRALDEKFKESKLGSTAIGQGFREMTTGKLADMKLAGISAEDAFVRDRELKASRDAIDTRNNILKQIALFEKIKAETGKLPESASSEIQSLLSKISPQEFVKHMREHDFHNPLIMQNTSSAQLKYFVDNAGKERHLDYGFMKEAARAANQDIADFITPAKDDLAKAVRENNKLLERVAKRNGFPPKPPTTPPPPPSGGPSGGTPPTSGGPSAGGPLAGGGSPATPPGTPPQNPPAGGSSLPTARLRNQPPPTFRLRN